MKLRHLCLASLVFATTAHGSEPSRDPLLDRAVTGTVADHGGARRTHGDLSAAYAAMARKDADAPVRNVILLIGDGMGDSEITAARNYAKGAGGAFKGLDALPVTGQYTHYSLDRETGLPNYVTDSAASATAFASGVKTYNGAIGVDIHGKPHPSILTLARKAGLATGNVSTAAIQDATPAAQYAHAVTRSCFGPEEAAKSCPSDARENGGKGSISEQLLDARADVTLGGGASSFAQKARAGRWKGKTLLQQARTREFTVVSNAAELERITAIAAGTPLLGLFAQGNMPVRWLGPRASHYGNIEQPPITCTPNAERTADHPSLAAMTGKAIALLSPSPKGFFLQVEGASIDKQAHMANPCGQIGETVDLDEAVQVALDFARREGQTLVIVTADHAHATQIISRNAKAPGLTAALNTRDGAVMSVSYGNQDNGGGHTGTQLRIAAYGPRAFNVSGLLDQTDVFFIIQDALKLSEPAGQ